MKRRVGLAPVALAATGLAFVVWTWLVVGRWFGGAFHTWDATSHTPGVDPLSPWGQILAALSIVTAPTVVYLALAGLCWWAARRRLQHLAWACGLSIPLTWTAINVVKWAIRRPRPETAAPLITASGWSYPSGHLVAATVLAVMIVAAMLLTRRPRAMVVGVAVVLAAGWWVLFYMRWALRAHWFTDLIGGGFLGGTVAVACLLIAGVHVIRVPDLTGTAPPEARVRRAAVIMNPQKVPDLAVFRRQLAGECAERGWRPPLWLETEPDDAGAAAAARARRRGVDLVFVAGGDGTVRTVCAGLADSGIPVAIIPVGTGNLLARNLGVPLDLSAALDLAFEGRAHPIDLLRIQADDRPATHSLVITGMGADALLMEETREGLKRVVGSAAYVMAALQAVSRPPFPVTVTLDANDCVETRAAVCLVANVGEIQGSISLAPDALADDGLLDVLLAAPRNAADWAVITTRVLSRSADTPGIERAQASRVVFEVDEPVPYQVDGDALGECRRLEASVQPRAVLVMVP